ncbi:LGFP repeat-containing protein [Mycolicibacter acidiphilus]|nr:hypothetical protein [Mycolicibacter acidiphilus]
MQTAAATPESDAHDAITAAWQAAGGDNSPLGAPHGDVYGAGPGFVQDFAGGKMFFTPDTGAKALVGAILDKYESMGGAASGLGFPNIDEVPGLVSPDSRMVTFAAPDNPVIFWTPEHGAHVVRGPINAAWDKLGSSTSPVGVPVEDESYDGAVVTQKFSSGELSFDSATRTFTTVPPELAGQLADLQVQPDPAAAIDQVWRAAGGASGILGVKQGELYPVGTAGVGQNFAGGKVYCTPTTGASAVDGDVLSKYESLGGPEGSDLGFPITSTADGPIAGSRFNSFGADDDPVIFASPDNGAFVVRSAMKAAWDKLDGASGQLGAPVGDQTVDGDLVSQKFTGGKISWNRVQNTFSTEPADLAKSLSGLQIPGMNLPNGSTVATGGGEESHFNLLWVLIPIGVLAVLGTLAIAALWWQRRKPAPAPAPARVSAPRSASVAVPRSSGQDDYDTDERWSSTAHHDAEPAAHHDEGTVRLPRRYGTLPTEPAFGAELADQGSDSPWTRYGETESHDEDRIDDDDDSDTTPTRVVVEEDFGTGRHAVVTPPATPPAAPPAAAHFQADESVHPVMHLPLNDPYQQPGGYPIKANIGSGLYYTPDNALYDDTLAEIWFATEEAARLNGFVRAS